MMPFPKKKKRGKTGFILVIKQPFRYHRKYSIILVLVCMQTHSLIEIDQCLICELQIHNSGRKHKFYSFTAVYEHCRHWTVNSAVAGEVAAASEGRGSVCNSGVIFNIDQFLSFFYLFPS